MSKQRIEIDHLQIRLKGVTPESARSAVSDLGRELLGQLGRKQVQGHGRTDNIEHMDAGAVRLMSGATAFELRRAIAGRIAASIDSTARGA
jgi:hypothetical protein